MLRIEGDPSQNGDVVLRLKTNSSVISIQEHSKKLILVAPLDKEVINQLPPPPFLNYYLLCSQIYYASCYHMSDCCAIRVSFSSIGCN